MKSILTTLILLCAFGAKAQTDDTQLLQGLINNRGAATQINITKNSNYQKDSFFVGDIYIPSGVVLQGINKPYIKAHSINFVNANKSGIKGFILEGTLVKANSTALVQILNSANINVEGNEIKNNYAEGVSAKDSHDYFVQENSMVNTDCGVLSNGNCFNFFWRRNYIQGGRSDGLAAFGKAFRNGIEVYNQTILSTDTYIIDRDGIIEDNIIEDKQGGNGIILRCAENVTVRNNVIRRAGFGVGAMQFVNFCQVLGNNSHGVERGYTGLFNYSSIINNIADSCSYGAWVGHENDSLKTYGTIVIGNSFRNCSAGAMFTGMISGIIQNNNVMDNRPFANYGYGKMVDGKIVNTQPTYVGFKVMYGSNNKIVGNTAECAFLPIQIEAAKTTLIYANVGGLLDRGTGTVQPEKLIDAATAKILQQQLLIDAATKKIAIQQIQLDSLAKKATDLQTKYEFSFPKVTTARPRSYPVSGVIITDTVFRSSQKGVDTLINFGNTISVLRDGPYTLINSSPKAPITP